MTDAHADGTDAAVLAAAADWLAAGHGVHLLTVVRTWGSSPRPAGSLLARRDDGPLAGSISGGCVEAELPRHLPDPGNPPCVLTFGGDDAEAARLGLPCGGRLAVLAEALTPGADGRLPGVRAAVTRGETLLRRVAWADGGVALHPDDGGPDLTVDDDAVAKRFGPAWRLLVVGAGDLGQHLAATGRRLGYAVTMVEPRSGHAPDVPGAALDTRPPDEAVAAWAPDARSAVVTTAHDPCVDDPALQAALDFPAFYIGALGSSRTHARRCERLRGAGVGGAALARLRAPVGLAIGSRTPAEIAVAVAAELVAVQRGRDPRGAHGAAP